MFVDPPVVHHESNCFYRLCCLLRSSSICWWQPRAVFFFSAKAAAQPPSQPQKQQKNSTWYTAVQQQRFNGRRARSSRLCVSSRGVSVLWLVHSSSRRSNNDNINASNAPVEHISSDVTRYSKHTAAAKTVLFCVAHACTYHCNVFPLLDLRRPQDIKETPSRKGALYMGLYRYVNLF